MRAVARFPGLPTSPTGKEPQHEPPRSPPQQTFVRLTLESLERRDNPADHGWTPVDGIYSINPVNWLKGPGIPYARYTVYEYAPRAGDNLYFSGALSNADCIIPPATQGQPMPPPPPPPYGPPSPPPPPPAHVGDVFNRITSQDGYAGSVEAGRDLQVNILEWGSGYLAQKNTTDLYSSNNTHAGDFTVSGELLWTGGGINAGPRAVVVNGFIVPGKVNLAPGATGLAEPTDGGTVDLGSNFTLQGDESNQIGSSFEMNNGTYNMLRGVIRVAAPSLLTLAPVPKGLGKPIDGIIKNTKVEKPETDEDGQVLIDSGGTATVKPKLRGNSTNQAEVKFEGKSPGMRNFGRVDIVDKTQMLIIPVGQTAHGLYEQNDDDAVTSLEAGCGIIGLGNSNVQFGRGVLEMVERRNSAGVPEGDQPAIFIRADEEFAGFSLQSNAKIKRQEGPKVPLLLDVTGKFLFYGTAELYSDRTEELNDRIVASDKIITGDDTKVAMFWINPNAQSVSTHPWTLLVSFYGGAGDPISSEPTFLEPPGETIPLTAGRMDFNKKYQVFHSD
jgi:hypothetical protein